MNISHTHGPWEWDGVSHLRGEFGQAVCRLPDYHAGEGPEDKAEQEATQRLLRAAPDMLAALVESLQALEDYGVSEYRQATARRAIRKARGES